MKRERDDLIDIAKGIGIILVVVGHVLPEYFVESIPKIGVEWIYSFHMPLFFVLAGFVFNCQNTITMHIKRLLIPYLIWSVVATIYELIGNWTEWKSVLFGNTYRIIIGYGMAPFWFLASLFVTIFICKVLSRLFLGGGWKQYAIFVSMIVITCIYETVIQNRIDGMNVYLYFLIQTIMRNIYCSVFVLLGIFLKGKLKKLFPMFCGKKVLAVVCLAIVSIVVSIINSGVNLQKVNVGNPILFYMGAFTGVLFVLNLANLFVGNTTLRKLGQSSMGIMCLHYKTIPIWGIINGLFYLIPLKNRIIVMILHITVLIIVCYLLTRIINKYAPKVLGKRKAI